MTEDQLERACIIHEGHALWDGPIKYLAADKEDNHIFWEGLSPIATLPWEICIQMAKEV